MRRIAYKTSRQNHWSMFLTLMIVVFLLGVVLYSSSGLLAELREKQQQKEDLQTQIAEEQKRTEQIEEYRKYTQTNKYIEEVAKEKLGLVYDGETIFRDEDSE